MSDRQMQSIFRECDKLKQIYDKCFADFFQKFVSPNYRHLHAVNPCERLHEIYRECVEEPKSARNIWAQKKINSRISKMDRNNLPPPQVVDAETRFNGLERTLEMFQENTRHLGVIASDYHIKSKQNLEQKINTMVSGLQELDQMRSQFNDVRIPLELLDVLDQGKNPNLYTKEMLERTVQKNKEVNGKTEMYKKFRASLLKELAEELPDDTMEYLKIREANNEITLRFIHVPNIPEEVTYGAGSNNPDIKYFLQRTYTECDPFVVGEYAWLRHRKKRVSWKTRHQVLSMIEEMAVGGDYRSGLKRGVNRRLPRGAELWDTETMGHNVYQVYSKWKADPIEPEALTVKTHPQFTYRKY